MGLREIESTLPPGFRFYPSDEELVCHYLYKKVTNERAAQGTLVEVDLHAREPWELPGEPLRPRSSSSLLFFFSFSQQTPCWEKVRCPAFLLLSPQPPVFPLFFCHTCELYGISVLGMGMGMASFQKKKADPPAGCSSLQLDHTVRVSFS